MDANESLKAISKTIKENLIDHRGALYKYKLKFREDYLKFFDSLVQLEATVAGAMVVFFDKSNQYIGWFTAGQIIIWTSVIYSVWVRKSSLEEEIDSLDESLEEISNKIGDFNNDLKDNKITDGIKKVLDFYETPVKNNNKNKKIYPEIIIVSLVLGLILIFAPFLLYDQKNNDLLTNRTNSGSIQMFQSIEILK